MITIQKIDKTEVSPSGNTILAEFRGLSTDEKPTTAGGKNIDNGSMFIEIDTGKIYLFDKSGSQWVEMIGGGSETNLQDKTVTITENATTTITADSGYDALSSVAVTTNVPASAGIDWSGIGYTEEPDCVKKSIQDGYAYAKNIYDNWDNSITNCNSKYVDNCQLIYFPMVDTSNVTNMNAMFSGCKALQTVPKLNRDKVTAISASFKDCVNLKEAGDVESTTTTGSFSADFAFQNCISLETVPMIKNSGIATSMYGTFKGCTNLKNVPQFDVGTTAGISSMNGTFTDCPNLTSTSLNNIMGMILGASSYTGTKTLKFIGLTETQATTCTGLSNWSALQTAGWTTGY